MTQPANPFRYFNSSPEVIRLVVVMSLWNVEDLLAERGMEVSYETIRFWWNRFGPMSAGEIGRWANNLARNSHLPFRRRERAMNRFRGMKTLQKFSSVHASIHNRFDKERHLVSRKVYKERRAAALAAWQAVMA